MNRVLDVMSLARVDFAVKVNFKLNALSSVCQVWFVAVQCRSDIRGCK